MFGLKLVRNLRGVEIGDRVLVRWSNFFGLVGKDQMVFKILKPRRLNTLDQVRWMRRFKYGFLYRGWFKNSSIYQRIDPKIFDSSGRILAYIIVEDWGAFILEGRSVAELLEDASLHPSFKRGGLFVKVM